MKKIILLLITSILVSFSTAKENNGEFTVMHGPGGVSDLTTRYIASNLSGKYPIINRPGAGGRIAINHMLKNETMLLATMIQVFATNPINFIDLEYKTDTDLEVLAIIGVMPSVLICNKKTGFKTFNDFLNSTDYISFGFGGYGSSEHIATEILIKETGVKSTMVPYAQGGNRAVTDLAGGHIDCMFGNYPTVKQHIQNDDLIVLMTSHRLSYNVTIWENVYKKKFPFQSYLAIVVPASMNLKIKESIKNDLENSFKNINYSQGLINLGLFPETTTDKNKIKQVISYIDSIKNLIIKNNIRTSG